MTTNKINHKFKHKPNFFIVGAPKCGTTALSKYLQSHPDIFITSPKEPHFFAEEFYIPKITTWSEYLSLFKDVQPQHKVIGEASVHYLCSELALSKIYQHNPDAKIVAMLRNPVDLVYSYHSQLLYNIGEEDESDFEKAWHLQASRRQGQNMPPLCCSPATLQYKNIGSLGTQVEKMFLIFPKKQIKVILFDDFKSSTSSVYQDVLTFLNVPNDDKTDFHQINKNRKHRISFLGKLTEKPPEVLTETVKSLKQSLGIKSLGIVKKIRTINREEFERPPLDTKFRNYLVDEFKDEIVKLSNILNTDLSHWLR